ncbi:hypothetical protein MGYG_03633 [Nannizzia gypsea CBS 118893]|uniref:Uncharacterized protein n=1 Tax=Arthroderma gypseum (strain ATCC MYA-4604 / CBS 118893) TaxID=535722 RepID=E4UT14_ARTGP|nr:hypothetical protein MGYG_03633 [Nannizzia gypsea CBS 118893]EFR00627.1 hypothetical protein MGYG_03633 [Nannizzia gypsea CBS 118893]
MAPSKKTVKPTSESSSSELSGSPALTHLTSNPTVSSPPFDSKPQIISKEGRHKEELVELLEKAGHWEGLMPQGILGRGSHSWVQGHVEAREIWHRKHNTETELPGFIFDPLLALLLYSQTQEEVPIFLRPRDNYGELYFVGALGVQD